MPNRTSSETSFIIVEEGSLSESRSSNSIAGKNIQHPSLASRYYAGASGSYAHDWSPEGTAGPIRTHGRHFLDHYGRVLNLRGVNLSGACKTPVNDDHDAFPAGWKTVTFVGRPFPLDTAHEHFCRLRRWGLTFIRFLITWEAVEHAGPGLYDTEYLTYIRELLSLLPQYGMTAFVSVHQDVWSRFSGGSGAPAWTLESVGFDLDELEATGAAWLKGVKGGGHTEDERGVWPCGYHKLAASTMATCFWAGDTFAPKLLVEDPQGKRVPVQQFLQGCFLDMFERVVSAVADLAGVIGFEMMNEPHPGYINLPSLHQFNYNTDLHLSFIPTAFESFQLGAGYATEVAEWTRSFPMPTKKTGSTILNTNKRRVWRLNGPTNGKCLWELHDVWGWDRNKNRGVVLREHYFVKHPLTGAKISFYDDFYFPFLQQWSERVLQRARPNALIIVEAIPNEFCPRSFTPDRQPPNMIYGPHWYDLNALFAKAFGDFTVNVQGLSRGMFPLKTFYWGQRGARDNYSLQIRNIVEEGYRSLGEKPIVIGETGVPMDMNNGVAFLTDDFTWQSRMMDAILTALDRSLVGFTLWNYNPHNNDKEGDDWNGENFSWFSQRRALPPSLLYYEQDSISLDNGGRILSAIVRPYPAKTAGIPVRFNYDMTTGVFDFEWAIPYSEADGEPSLPTVNQPPLRGHPPLLARETEIFVPSMLTLGRELIVTGLRQGDVYHYDPKRQTLFVVVQDMTSGQRHKIRVELSPSLKPPFIVNDFWDDFGTTILSISGAFVGVVVYILLKYYS